MSEPEKNTLEKEVKVSKKVSNIRKDIKELTLVEVSELIEGVKEDFNIQETALVQPTAVSAAASEKVAPESGGNVAIKVTEIKKDKGLSMIKVFGAIQGVINELNEEGQVNIVQAKKLAEEGEKIIVEKVAREKAE